MPYSPSSEKVPRTIPLEVLERLIAPFIEQIPEEGPVYVALGCGRVYVAHEPSEHCKRCQGRHENHKVTQLEDLAGLEKIDIYV